MKPIKSFRALLIVLFSIYSLSGCTTTELASSLVKPRTANGLYKVGKPYVIDGRTYYPSEVASYTEQGQASWYGPGFHGRQTANGEEFDTTEFTAAHRTLPMPSVVRVTNLENGNTVMVRINDRGPFKRDRVLDVSQAASKALGFHIQGSTRVRVEFMPEESQMVAEAAKNGNVMTLAEVQSKMSQRLAAQQLPPPMAVAATQTKPVETINLIAPAQAADVPTAQVASPSMPAVPRAMAVDHVLREPAQGTSNSAKISHRIYVQVGAYQNRTHANAVVKKVASIANHLVDTVTRGGVKLYRVRLVASNQQDAKKMLSRVNGLGYGSAKVVAE